jgi:hypothetical protein
MHSIKINGLRIKHSHTENTHFYKNNYFVNIHGNKIQFGIIILNCENKLYQINFDTPDTTGRLYHLSNPYRFNTD